jgi:hypothetical protein
MTDPLLGHGERSSWDRSPACRLSSLLPAAVEGALALGLVDQRLHVAGLVPGGGVLLVVNRRRDVLAVVEGAGGDHDDGWAGGGGLAADDPHAKPQPSSSRALRCTSASRVPRSPRPRSARRSGRGAVAPRTASPRLAASGLSRAPRAPKRPGAHPRPPCSFERKGVSWRTNYYLNRSRWKKRATRAKLDSSSTRDPSLGEQGGESPRARAIGQVPGSQCPDGPSWDATRHSLSLGTSGVFHGLMRARRFPWPGARVEASCTGPQMPTSLVQTTSIIDKDEGGRGVR